jgi:hypothetical protein
VRVRSAVLCAQSELWITKLSWVQLNSGSVHLTRGRTTALASLTRPACESKRRPEERGAGQTSDLKALACDPPWALGGAPGNALGHQREPFGERRVYWVNPLGVKGLGELKNVGVNPAVANAVFHATG